MIAQQQHTAGKLDQSQLAWLYYGHSHAYAVILITGERSNRPQRNLRRKGELPAQQLARRVRKEVEVKNNSRASLAQDAINRLSMLIQNSRGGAGLVVTTRPDKATPYLKGAQPIVVAPFPELCDWLRSGTFEQEFLDIVGAFWMREQ